ncbi:hypothetical protein WA026_022140 [Henosepilachna vigintioctopunctata]|uniref:Mpv17-like protein n=1 Tax=Henosepilachna vigintioctopunctata TaxID=420089 RepID=A0AAW1TRA7_9CUCU
MKLFKHIIKLSRKYPIIRGLASYAIICPAGCLFQQTYEGKNLQSFDWVRVLTFSCYGVVVVAPMLHGWVRVAGVIWPKENLRNAVKKALVEQFTYGPASMLCFYTVMPILEGKSLEYAIQEQLKPKFISTYKIALCYWPFVQTLNFSLVPARNRVPFVSVCSFIWWIFLAHMNNIQTSLKGV